MKMMDRLELIRKIVDDIVRQQTDHAERRCGFVHLYGVSAICVLLALKRGLDPHICGIAGMLHDISSYKTGDPTDHARLSAREAETILQGTGQFTATEIGEICTAIAQHRAKAEVDGQLSELLKDADVVQHYLYNPMLPENPALKWEQRLHSALLELGLHVSATHLVNRAKK